MQNLYYLGYTDFEEWAEALDIGQAIYLLGHVHSAGNFERGRDQLMVTAAQVQQNTLHYVVVPINEFLTVNYQPVNKDGLDHKTKYPYYLGRVRQAMTVIEDWLKEQIGEYVTIIHALPYIPEPRVLGDAKFLLYHREGDYYYRKEGDNAQGNTQDA